MSLRSKGADPPDAPDEESQSLLVDKSTPERSAPKGARVAVAAPQNTTTTTSSAASPAISAFDRMASANNNKNPILLAKLVGRRFLQLMISEEDADPGSNLGFAIGLLKDIILGIVLGVLTISLVIVLDHRNIIHLQSAHHLRDNVYATMSNPDNLAYLEEETGMKFMSFEEYDSMKKEIDSSLSLTEQAKTKLDERTKELEERKKELETVKEEYEKAKSDPKFKELDNFCDSCKWGPTNCGARVNYLIDTYNQGKISAMMALMKEGKCKKS